MLDINKAINDPNSQHDPEGHMYGLATWSYETAQTQARKEGLGDLTDLQWRVIHTLRGLHRKNGRAESAGKIMPVLERKFVSEGGSQQLYQLFPLGPVSQGSRLAGVPVPP